MINPKDKTEGSNSNYAESESVPGTEDSVSSQQENRGKRLESMKKLKKVRSIRLHRFSSIRSSRRIGKPQNENLPILSPIGTENPQGPNPIEISDASPHYMKGTSSSHAKESFQNTQTQRVFSKKTLTRMSTLKLKRSLTRKLSGRTDQKRKLKSSRSIKIGTFKGSKSTRKVPEFIHGSDDNKNWKSTSDNTQAYSTNDGNKPQRAITRRLSFKPVRILKKMPTFKSKNSSMEKGHYISQSPESSLHRATCSSTLKDSHFTDHIELSQEGSGSQVVSTMKVCPYTYCSLHGHHCNDLPTMKRFVSMRRRQLKFQKSMKMDGRAVARSKQSGNNARKATQKTRNFHGESGTSHFRNVKKLAKDSSVRPQDTKGCTLVEGSTSSGEDEKYKFRYDTEVLPRETSYSNVINFEESTSMDVVKSCASDIGILEGEVATKAKNMEGEGDNEAVLMSSVQKEAELSCANNVPYRMQERDDKYMKMWHLVYKHAVLANTGREENKLPFDGNGKEGGGKEAQSFDGVNSSSSQDHFEMDHDEDDENKSLIDLVQKAFDEILLPEPENLSSDDDLKSRGIGSDEELLENSEDNRGEGNISASRESPQEEMLPKDDSLRSHAEEMTGQRMGSKPEPKTPKSWSNLKKLIVLRRFVKALEKVRKLNFRRPRHLPLDADLEAEKVLLKHQTTEEKRSAEEWMLDYALQKVISKLAPAQRQRVALLVEAFETIRPFQDAQNGSLSSTTMETQANPIQPLDDSLDHGKEETNKDNASDDPMPELHNPIVLKERCLDYPGTGTVESMPAPGAVEEESNSKRSLASSYDDGEKALNGNDNVHLAEIKDSGSRSLSEPVKNISSCHEEAPKNGIVNEVPDELISNSDTGSLTSQSESSGGDLETKNKIGTNSEQFSLSKSLILRGLARSLGTNLVGSGESSDLLDEDERIEKANPVTSTLEEIPANEQSKAPMSTIVERETQPEKQNYKGLWYLVYKHMVSDSAGNDSKSLSDGADEKASEYECSTIRGTSIPYESTHATNQDMEFEDHSVADPEVELQQIEAIKMVEEAIDSIIPDVQDHTPDTQLLTDNTVSDNTEQSCRTERVTSEGLNQKEERIASGNGTTQEQKEEEEEGTASKEGNNPNQQLPKSWSNLKKVIMLRRFIKALEKVRKFNPRGPRYLPIEPDSEAEKVNLRHQDMAERKGTEEWMLDYALRQVVSKLTPARKRKVELLVEAFETVMPTITN